LRELGPLELAAWIQRGDDFDLIDVREPHEWEIARIPGARLIPLGEIAEQVNTLSRERTIVLHCKGGTRSAKAASLLQAAGFQQLWNLTGGISRWSDEVDPTVPRY
jgi:adenylyltransferase/sulfurtransferase